VGKRKELIGYETSEQLDVEPAKHFVLVTKREKRACHRCEELLCEGDFSDGKQAIADIAA
jgi:transposase